MHAFLWNKAQSLIKKKVLFLLLNNANFHPSFIALHYHIDWEIEILSLTERSFLWHHLYEIFWSIQAAWWLHWEDCADSFHCCSFSLHPQLWSVAVKRLSNEQLMLIPAYKAGGHYVWLAYVVDQGCSHMHNASELAERQMLLLPWCIKAEKCSFCSFVTMYTHIRNSRS